MNQSAQLEKFLMNGPLVFSYIFATLVITNSVTILMEWFK